MGALIHIENMKKIYNPGENEVRALDGIDLDIEKGDLVAIVGHSGSGKSTLMNMLGCLDTPTSGKYVLDGQDVASMTDNQLADVRNKEIGFIFQGFNLISNLDAVGNVELPLVYRGVSKNERKQLAMEALKSVGLEDRMKHKPNEMSGGQQQRIAIARALLLKPSVLLLDEPFSALDAKIRAQMREELKRIQEELNITVVFVTHDQEEALSMSDTVVVMDGGKIQQIGTPQEVFDHPANLFVAGFIGMPQMNFFDAKLTRQNGRYAVTVGGVTVELSDEKQQRLAEHNVAEQDVTLGVRPDHLMLCADGIKGTVDVSEMMGSSVHLHVAAEGKDVIVIVPTNGAAAHFPMGSEVNMIFGGNVAHVFDKETGKNLEW